MQDMPTFARSVSMSVAEEIAPGSFSRQIFPSHTQIGKKMKIPVASSAVIAAVNRVDFAPFVPQSFIQCAPIELLKNVPGMKRPAHDTPDSIPAATIISGAKTNVIMIDRPSKSGLSG